MSRKKIFISCDLNLEPFMEKFFRESLDYEFPGMEQVWGKVKGHEKSSYLELLEDCDVVVVLFLGYSLERYEANLRPHLLFGKQLELMGMNIDGTLFQMPHESVNEILNAYKKEKAFWSFMARLFHVIGW